MQARWAGLELASQGFGPHGPNAIVSGVNMQQELRLFLTMGSPGPWAGMRVGRPRLEKPMESVSSCHHPALLQVLGTVALSGLGKAPVSHSGAARVPAPIVTIKPWWEPGPCGSVVKRQPLNQEITV